VFGSEHKKSDGGGETGIGPHPSESYSIEQIMALQKALENGIPEEIGDTEPDWSKDGLSSSLDQLGRVLRFNLTWGSDGFRSEHKKSDGSGETGIGPHPSENCYSLEQIMALQKALENGILVEIGDAEADRLGGGLSSGLGNQPVRGRFDQSARDSRSAARSGTWTVDVGPVVFRHWTLTKD